MAGVDWSKVNYGGGASAPSPAPAPHQGPPQAEAPAPAPRPAPAPAPSPSPAAPPVTESNNNVQQSNGKNTASTSNNPSGAKRGLAYNYQSPNLGMFDQYQKLTWAHNWDSNRAGLPSHYDYVPTLHSTKSVHTGQWEVNVKKAISSGKTTYLMSFNEPDIPDQANMNPAVAVAGFNQYMKQYASDNVKLGSPSVSNGVGTNPSTGQPQGLDWLKPFLKQCTGCPISFVPVHWYGCTNGCSTSDDVALFKKQMIDAMNTAVVNGQKVPVWIPEFQCHGDAQGFLKEVLPWLDGQGQIERYSYFMVRDGILAQGNGVSALGVKYASA
ncbi:MAG: hypothetical protein Q9217_005554 [Psora testacea]